MEEYYNYQSNYINYNITWTDILEMEDYYNNLCNNISYDLHCTSFLVIKKDTSLLGKRKFHEL